MLQGGKGVRLAIESRAAEPKRFSRQVDLIKSSGAIYDSDTKTWTCIVTDQNLAARVLEPLFQAAREHGTHVRVTDEPAL
jgi:hypothetical protein